MIDTIAIEPLEIAEIKRLYPDEWVLIGDPNMDENLFDPLSGIVLYHSKDKREVAYLGRVKALDYQTTTLIYTGTFKSMRKMVSLFYPRKNDLSA